MVYHVLYPEYYQKFSCIGGACQHNCCKMWTLPVTKTDYDKLRNWRGDKAIKEVIDQNIRRVKNGDARIYGEVRRDEQGSCNFLDGEGLCTLQKNCGAEMLPITCQTFPRAASYLTTINMGIHTMYPACEEVVRLLIEEKDGIGFVMEEESAPSNRNLYIKGDDSIPYQHYLDIKSAFIDILQNRAYTMNERMILLGIALKNYLDKTDWTELSMREWLRQTISMAEGEDYRKSISEMKTEKGYFTQSCIIVCMMIPEIRGQILEIYEAAVLNDHLVAVNLEKALEMQKNFDENSEDGEILLENLMVNLFCQLNIPFQGQSSWPEYCNLACLYRVYRFILSSYYSAEKGLADMLFPIVHTSRGLLNNVKFKKGINDLLEEREQNTLAHIVMLLNS